MNKVLQFIDKYIDKIPVHIRDIIQKAFIMLAAVAGVVAIAYGIKMGAAAAKPGGKQLFEDVSDMFYKEQIIEENMQRNELEILPLDFDSKEMSSDIEGERVPDYIREQQKQGFVTRPEGFELGEDPYRNTDDTKFQNTNNDALPELPQTESGKREDSEIPTPETEMAGEPTEKGDIPIERTPENIPTTTNTTEKQPDKPMKSPDDKKGAGNDSKFLNTDE
ncbi:MAG: hypothetical protein ABUK01_06580 [Leptospirales bacterium]